MTCIIYLGFYLNTFQSNEYLCAYIKFCSVTRCVHRSQFCVLWAQHLVSSSFTIVITEQLSNKMRFSYTRLKFFMHERKKNTRLILIGRTKETKRTPFPKKFLCAFFVCSSESIWMEDRLWQINWYSDEWILKLQLLPVISLISISLLMEWIRSLFIFRRWFIEELPFQSAK